MAISYEEALETLQSMFSEPWTRDTLDAILRHQKGHMENTVDFILRHTDKDPQTLVDQLHAGINPDDSTAALDAALARQLSQGQQQQQAAATTGPSSGSGGSTGSTGAAAAATGGGGGRGTPTVLPDDFLRIPGRSRTAAGSNAPAANATATTATTTSASTMESDAALARMLQDELFSEELARNPDFAHLARGRPRTAGGVPVRGGSSARAGAPPPQPGADGVPNSPNIMHKITELGDNARKRLQLMAAQFNARNANMNNPLQVFGGNKNKNDNNNPTNNASSPNAASERRGLLDDNDHDDLELAARKDL